VVSQRFRLATQAAGSPRFCRFCLPPSPGSDRFCRTLRCRVSSRLSSSSLSSFVWFLPPFAPQALPCFFATTASADFSSALTDEFSPGKVQNLSPRAVRLYRSRPWMTFGLCCSTPTRRPRSASLPVRIPTVEGLLPASFSFTSRLRLAVRYGCRHLLRRAPFISIDSAHAGHTWPGTPGLAAADANPHRETSRPGMPGHYGGDFSQSRQQAVFGKL